MSVPGELKYTKEHEWVKVEGETLVVCITEHAQDQLGDVVFVELPDLGKAVEQNGDAAVVESVKAASEVYAPVSGEIIEVNSKLEDDPELVNRAPTGDGWFIKIRLSDPSQLDGMMDEATYNEFVASQG